MVQNVGDGSLFHSSFLNIRFCVAAGANITFKILYNGFVANTGAQEMVGGKPVPELTRMLELEGVRTTVVLTKDPDAYRGAGARRQRARRGRSSGRTRCCGSSRRPAASPC